MWSIYIASINCIKSYLHQSTSILRMWLITFTLFLGILAVNADPFCPSGCPCKASCRSIWDTNQIKNCPVDSEYRCVDLPGCERYREYCFCIGNEKYEKSTDTCVGINECDVAELTDICTNDRPTGPGYCGDNDACTLSNISCSTVSQPICCERYVIICLRAMSYCNR